MPQDESCQYLSVTVPEDAGTDLPVMVWVHGGAFEVGGCDLCDRIPLATECGVIVVGLGYRLGVLGFLKGRDGKLSNNGILDLIEGLRWVKENISSFGGDPDRITLFGESAGAEAVKCIMLSEGTEDLYRRAIIQSDPIGAMSNRTAMAEKMLEELNRMPVDVDIGEVKRVQADVKSHITEKGPAKFMAFGPNYGVFPLPEESGIPDRIRQIASGHEIIIGTNAREVAVFIGHRRFIVALDRFVLTRWIVESIIRKVTYRIFTKPAEDFARLYADSGGRAYLYRFYWMKDHDYIGACHASDVQMIFGAKGMEGMDIAMGKTESEILEEGRPMRRMWAEFARTGEVEEAGIDGVLTIGRIGTRRYGAYGTDRQRPSGQESRIIGRTRRIGPSGPITVFTDSEGFRHGRFGLFLGLLGGSGLLPGRLGLLGGSGLLPGRLGLRFGLLVGEFLPLFRSLVGRLGCGVAHLRLTLDDEVGHGIGLLLDVFLGHLLELLHLVHELLGGDGERHEAGRYGELFGQGLGEYVLHLHHMVVELLGPVLGRINGGLLHVDQLVPDGHHLGFEIVYLLVDLLLVEFRLELGFLLTVGVEHERNRGQRESVEHRYEAIEPHLFFLVSHTYLSLKDWNCNFFNVY